MTYDDENKYNGIVLVSEDAQEYLNPRQEVTYREHRRELVEWMLSLGKNPDKAEGYRIAGENHPLQGLDESVNYWRNHRQTLGRLPNVFEPTPSHITYGSAAYCPG